MGILGPGPHFGLCGGLVSFLSQPHNKKIEAQWWLSDSTSRLTPQVGGSNHELGKVTSEEEIKGNEVRGVWRPRSRFAAANPSSEICSKEVVMHRNRNIWRCPIVHEPHVVVRSDRHSLQ
ncbi:hypothetical protein TNCV_3127591 [Trichonephila clavipes]|nr:hypothetical protein TNCV_3127591 [Trichonephila clavipes]